MKVSHQEMTSVSEKFRQSYFKIPKEMKETE